MKMKCRVLAAVLAAFLTFAVAGCKGGGSDVDSSVNSSSLADASSAEPRDSSEEAVSGDAQSADHSESSSGGATVNTSKTNSLSSKGNTAANSSKNNTPTNTSSSGGNSGNVNYTCKTSDYVSNISLWKTPVLSEDTPFQFEIEMTYVSQYQKALLQSSIKKQGLGDYLSALPSQTAKEWGYSITHLDGSTDGAGNKITTNFSGANAPKTRQEAVSKLKNFLFSQYIKDSSSKWLSMNGHYPWHHYAGEFGASVISSEIGENINNYQWHIALTRGAARQYGTPWGIDFSNWHGPSILDNTIKSAGEKGIWNESHPNGGHSLNLMERSFVMSYMSGADSIVAEAGSVLSFYNTLSGSTYKLSPYGEVCQKFNKFVTANKDVGICYTPVGIVLDYYHGAYSGFDGRKAFYNFAYNNGDNMTWNLINMIWPGGWEIQTSQNEKYAMINGPYGDNFDILLQNASQEVLNSYPALLLSGDITLSSSEISRYKAYVNQGGTLILNTAFVKFFPEFKGTLNSSSRYDKTYGKGKVIVYGSDYSVTNLDSILKEVLNSKLPFSISTNVQSITNIKDGSMFITLINNEGVTKAPKTTVSIDSSKKKIATVRYKGNLAIKSVKDIYSSTAVSVSGNKATITVPAGGIVVLEFKFD